MIAVNDLVLPLTNLVKDALVVIMEVEIAVLLKTPAMKERETVMFMKAAGMV